MVQVIAKTVVQQKHSKDYNLKVESYNQALKDDRRRRRKIKS